MKAGDLSAKLRPNASSARQFRAGRSSPQLGGRQSCARATRGARQGEHQADGRRRHRVGRVRDIGAGHEDWWDGTRFRPPLNLHT